MFTRHPQNPLIAPRDVTPSRPDFEVIGTFNAGVTEFKGQVVLLVRVAERPIQTEANAVLYPYMAAGGEIQVGEVRRDNPNYDLGDARLIQNRNDGHVTLTSISHIRRAFSDDGVHFKVDKQPWLCAEPPYETLGIEDPRITFIDGIYYINYSAVSPYGISTALISTRDFENVERHGVIFPPANRDVVIFPERINGQFVCYHRPMPAPFGDLNVWLATSPDLLHWGEHRILLETQPGGWEAGRVGGGAPPLRTERGWLSIYHAATPQNHYCLGAFLTPLDYPERIIARSREPILAPESKFETTGFFPNVVFTCGALLQNGTLKIYYGAADETIALAEAPVNVVLDSLVSVNSP